MKEFLVGLLFLLVASVLLAVGILLYPLLLALACIIFAILAIWLLGKLILYLQAERKKGTKQQEKK